MGLSYSAWTLPWLLDFKQKVAQIPVIEGTGTGTFPFLNNGAEGRADVGLGDWDRLADVIDDTEGSLIRVMDGLAVVDEWICQRVSRKHDSDYQIAGISGATLAWIFDRYPVPAYDGGVTSPAVAPNWMWGADNILSDPGFEGISGTAKIFELMIEATAGTFFLGDFTDTTSAIAYNASAATIETRIQTDLGLFTDVIVVQTGTSPVTFTIQMVTPLFGVNLDINIVSLTGNATTTTIQEGGFGLGSWTVAQSLISGLAAPGTYDELPFVSSTQAHSGTYSCRLNPGPIGVTTNRGPGIQQVVGVTGGQLYQASVWVYPTSPTDRFRLGIFGVGEESIAWNNPSGVSYPANSWVQISLPDVLIPVGTTQIIYRVQCTNPGVYDPSIFYVDDAEFYPGLVETTPGDILDLTLTAFGSPLVDWIDYSTIGVTTDSGGTTWPEDIAFEIVWGEHFGHVLDRFVDLGYEWELRPKATPIGTLTHDLFLYVPGGRDAAPTGVAVNGAQDATYGEVVKRIPDYTSVIVEGAGLAWTEDTDTTAETNFGYMRVHSAQRQLLDDPTRQLAATELLAYESANRSAIRLEVVEPKAHRRPGLAYRPGDTVPFQNPPAMPKESRRVQRIDYVNTKETTYVVTGSRLLGGEAAAYDLIWRMWRRFNRPTQLPPTTPSILVAGGGEFTITFCASDSTEEEIAKADYQCVGSNDQVLINSLMNKMDNGSLAGAKFVFATGTYHFAINQWAIDYAGLAGSAAFEFCGTSSALGGRRTKFVVDSATGSAPRRLINNTTMSLTIRDIAFDANAMTSASAVLCLFNGAVKVYDCLFYNGFEFGVYASSNAQSIVQNSRFDGNGIDIVLPAGSIAVGNICLNATATTTDAASIQMGGGSTPANESVVAHNTISGADNYGIYVAGYAHVHHNTVTGSGDSGIYLDGVNSRIESNNVGNAGFHGIETKFSNITAGFLIKGNVIYNPQRHGIFVDQPFGQVYDNHVVSAGLATANTYDGIHISHNAARVMRNTIEGASGVTRYGIRIDTGTGSIVVLNDFHAAADFGSGTLSDAGTSTVTVLPSGGIGDNFAT